MKVGSPIKGLYFTSGDVLPASCTSKPQVNYTSIPKQQKNQGLSNQEIYEGLVNVKNHIVSLFGGQPKSSQPLNYLA